MEEVAGFNLQLMATLESNLKTWVSLNVRELTSRAKLLETR